MNYKQILAFLTAIFIFSWSMAEGQEKIVKTPLITIRVQEGQNIRDISQKHLSNPDLWEDILYANRLKTPDQIRAGMILRIPAQAIIQANKEVEHARRLIRQATDAGAKIFAPHKISQAIEIRNAAIEKRKAGEWSLCRKQAISAAKEAKKALDICIANQDVPAEAVVDYCKGKVHRRKPSDNLWKGVSRYDILVEGEKIRTLSNSFADVLFRDNSRLQLRENAQALIRQMRANLLENTGEAKISLIKGDVLALLSGGKEEEFHLDVKGIDAKINSKRFRAGHDDDDEVSWFAVDEGQLEIESKGKKVVLKKNQGSVVPNNQKPSAPKELLPPPQLLDPPDGEERFDLNTALTWKRVKGAEKYLLEISDNASFSRVIRREKILDASAKSPKPFKGTFPRDLGPGAYYWRVTAISPEKLPGRLSRVRFIRIIEDKEPPFLVIESPKEGAILSESTVEIFGSTETKASLIIQDQPLEVAADGTYRYRYKLSEGTNHIIISATDRAGNVSHSERIVTFLPGGKIDLTFDPLLQKIGPDRFLLRHHRFALSGKTYSNSRVIIRNSGIPADVKSGAVSDDNFSATALADDEGRFQMNLRARGDTERFIVEVISEAGEVRKSHFAVEIDNRPPSIHFNSKIPVTTSQKELSISGKLEDGIRLSLNKQNIPLEKVADHSNFSFQFSLKPGDNRLHFDARDLAGNVTVIEKAVLFDPDAPQFVIYKISPKRVRGGERAEVAIRAKDATGLRKTAPYKVQIGTFSHTGQMTYSAPKGEYVASFYIPKHIRGAVKLRNVTLSDYLGNSKKYSF